MLGLGGTLPLPEHGSGGSSNRVGCMGSRIPLGTHCTGRVPPCAAHRSRSWDPRPNLQSPAWGAWVLHTKGSVCPVEVAQHPARLRLHWHLPFIGCGEGSGGRGAGRTLPPGVFSERWEAQGHQAGAGTGGIRRAAPGRRVGVVLGRLSAPVMVPRVQPCPATSPHGRAGCVSRLPAQRA